MVSLIRQQKPLIFMSNSVKNQLILISFFGIQKFGMYTKLPTIQWKSKKSHIRQEIIFCICSCIRRGYAVQGLVSVKLVHFSQMRVGFPVHLESYLL